MKRTTILLVSAVLAGCASLQDVRPWAGIELHDQATRAAMPRWQDAGRLWIGIRGRFLQLQGSGPDLVLRNASTGAVLRLHASECASAPILALLRPERRAEFHAASATVRDQVHAGCWIEREETDTAVVVFEDGSVTEVRMRDFVPLGI